MAENQKGTFIVKINHTDNASWQGQVTWADKNITKNFLKIHIIFCPPICPRSIHLSLSHSRI